MPGRFVFASSPPVMRCLKEHFSVWRVGLFIITRSLEHNAGGGRSTSAQVAVTVFASGQAMVIGPTPPGTGVIAPAIGGRPLARDDVTLAADHHPVDADIDHGGVRLGFANLKNSLKIIRTIPVDELAYAFRDRHVWSKSYRFLQCVHIGAGRAHVARPSAAAP